MNARTSADANERVLALARRAEPPAQASTDARRMVRAALLAGHARRTSSHERRTWLALAAAPAALALAAFALNAALHDGWLGGARDGARGHAATPAGAAASATKPLRLQLPTGDTLVATAGAQFELERIEAQARSLQLRRGSLAFDVRPLRAGERFAVQTPHLRAHVHGTVFSVEVDARRTRVRVYEGRVLVADARGEHALAAGSGYGSDGVAVSVGSKDEDPLAQEARAMAVKRVGAGVSTSVGAGVSTSVSTSVGASVGVGVSTSADASERERTMAREALPPHVADAETAVPAVSLEQAREWLHAGDAGRALQAARHNARVVPAAERGGWLLLQGDALRSLERAHEALAAYRAAVEASRGAARALAGWKAADLALRRLDDPLAALAALDHAAVDQHGSELRERGLLLRVQALDRIGAPCADLAERYLAEFPDSAGAAAMQAIATRP